MKGRTIKTQGTSVRLLAACGYNKSMKPVGQGSKMKSHILGTLAVVLLTGPMAAGADIVTWEARGNITRIVGAIPGFESALVGDPYVVTWSFDTEAALLIKREGSV
jgi:hypothetical protein